MSEHFTDRTKMMLGEDACERLRRARVAVFGVGGVGGYATEALARAGVGAIDLIDSDRVSLSNINRQIIATHSTVGQYKTEAQKARIRDINPDCRVLAHTLFYSAETADELDLGKYDYIIDAIDSVSSKIELIARAKEVGAPIISAMGAGNKLDPTRFRVADISKTAVCPLAKAVRVALRKRGINHLKVVYSEEPPVKAAAANPSDTNNTGARPVPGSVSFVPSVMGLILAGEVIKDISNLN